MTKPTRQEAIDKVASLVKDIKVALITSVDAGGMLRARPMWTQDAPFDGTLWFLTSHDSSAAREITGNPRVNVGYSSTSSEEYLSVSGQAEILNDRARIAEFWNPMLKAWYEGPDDPTIRCIRIAVDEAEYWDAPGGKIGSLFSIAKGVLTGDHDTSDNEHGTVKF